MTNASRSPTLPRLRISHRTTIPRRTILPAAAATAPPRILDAVVIVAMIAAGTVAAIAAVVAVGDAVADALAVDARKAAQAVGAICLPQNMLRHKAANPAATTIVAANLAPTTIAALILRALRRHPLPLLPRTKSFFPANRSLNIAASLR